MSLTVQRQNSFFFYLKLIKFKKVGGFEYKAESKAHKCTSYFLHQNLICLNVNPEVDPHAFLKLIAAEVSGKKKKKKQILPSLQCRPLTFCKHKSISFYSAFLLTTNDSCRDFPTKQRIFSIHQLLHYQLFINGLANDQKNEKLRNFS